MPLRLLHFPRRHKGNVRDNSITLQNSPKSPSSPRSPAAYGQFFFGTDTMTRKRHSNEISSKISLKNGNRGGVKQKEQVKKSRWEARHTRIIALTCCPVLLCLVAYEFRDVLFSFINDTTIIKREQETGGWRVADPQTEARYGSDICTLDRRRSDDLTLAEFEQKYRYKKPVIVTFEHGAPDWTEPDKWSVDSLKKEYGEWYVVAGNSRDIVRKGGSGYIESSFSSYVDKLMSETDIIGEPLYMFDRQFYNDSSLPATLKPPPYFKIRNGVDDSIFFLGSSATGVSFHKHADAWNGVIFGRKRWFLYSTEKTPPGGVYPGYTQLEWFQHIYPSLPDGDKPMECIQGPGEILYLPEGMYHATINMGDTIAIGIQKKRATTEVEKLFYQEPDLTRKIHGEQNKIEKLKLMERKVVIFETLLQLLPHNAEVHMKLGRIYADIGRYEEGIKHTQQAIDLDQHFVLAVLNLAGMHTQLGNLEAAESMFRLAVDMNPDLWDVYAQYGDFLINNQRPQDAARMYTKGTELQPESLPFWTQLVIAQERAGDADAAKVSKAAIDKLRKANEKQGT